MQSVEIATPPVTAQRNVSSAIAIFNLWKLCRLTGSVPFDLLAIGLFACLDRVVQSILLTINRVAAFFHNVTRDTTGIFAEIRGLLLQEFLALVGLAPQDVAGFLARLRREQEADTDANTESEEKVCQSVFVHVLSPET